MPSSQKSHRSSPLAACTVYRPAANPDYGGVLPTALRRTGPSRANQAIRLRAPVPQIRSRRKRRPDSRRSKVGAEDRKRDAEDQARPDKGAGRSRFARIIKRNVQQSPASWSFRRAAIARLPCSWSVLPENILGKLARRQRRCAGSMLGDGVVRATFGQALAHSLI